MSGILLARLYYDIKSTIRKITDEIQKFETRLEDLKSDKRGREEKILQLENVVRVAMENHDRNSRIHKKLHPSGNCKSTFIYRL